jgi:hypothetical protein
VERYSAPVFFILGTIDMVEKITDNKHTRGDKNMYVDKREENYLINDIGLTKKQIKEMLPSEIDKYCDEVIRKRIDALGVYRPEEDIKKKEKLTAKYHR